MRQPQVYVNSQGSKGFIQVKLDFIAGELSYWSSG